MKALLLKDWYLLRKRWGVLFGMVLLFSVIAGVQTTMLYTLMTTMMLLMISLNTLAYDQHDGWDAYACALPLSRAQLVLSKYVLACICIVVSVILVLVSTLLFGGSNLLASASAQLAFGFFFVACNFPLIIRFGFEKSRVYYLVVAGVLIGLGSVFSQYTQPSFSAFKLSYLLPLVGLLALLGSLKLSISFMKNKDFSET